MEKVSEDTIQNMEYVCSYFSSNDTGIQTPSFDAIAYHFKDSTISLYVGLLITTSRRRRLEHPYPNSKEAFSFRLPYFEIQERLFLSLKVQTQIRKRVKEAGLVKEFIFGNDGYKNYSLDWNRIAEIVRNYENRSKSNLVDRRHFLFAFSGKAPVSNEVQYPNPLKSPAYAEREDGKEGGRSKLDARNPLKSPAYAEREDYKREEKYGKSKGEEKKPLDSEDSSKGTLSRGVSSASLEISSEEKKPLPKKREKLPLPKKEITLPKGNSHGFIQPKGVVRQKIEDTDYCVSCSPEVYGLLIYWNAEHGTVTHKIPELVQGTLRNPTRSIEKCICVLNEMMAGTFFQKDSVFYKYNKPFTSKDIKKSMDNHRRACFDHAVLPTNKSSIVKQALLDFLYNPRVIDMGMKYGSPMLFYLLNPPIDSKTYVPEIKMTEREQVCYDALLKHMEKTVKVDNAKHWTDFDLKCFRMAARHANRFSLDYDKVFMGDIIYTPGGAMLWYIKMATKVNDDEFSPELLASRFTPMKIQSYLEKEGHWSESGFYVGLDYLADRPELCRMVGRMRSKVVSHRFLVEYRFQNKIPKDPEERKLFNAQLDEYEAQRDVMVKEYESNKIKPVGNMKRRS